MEERYRQRNTVLTGRLPVSSIAGLRTALANSAVTTILVNPGSYTISEHDTNTTWLEAGVFINRDVTIKVNGTGSARADFYSGSNFTKGLFVVAEGTNVTFDGIGFYNTRDTSPGNVPGIRAQGESLTILNCDFENNNNAILGAALPGATPGTLIIDNSRFVSNGDLWGGGQEHHVYFEGAVVEVSDSYFEDSGYGHAIKIVASDHATITNNVIDDAGSHANSAINSTGGGDLTVTGNTITKSGSSQNPNVVYYETIRGDGTDGVITISNNIIYSDHWGTKLLWNMSNSVAVVSNNQLHGTPEVFSNTSFVGLMTLTGNTLNGTSFNTGGWQSQATLGTSGVDTHILTNNGLYYDPSNFYDGAGGNDLILGSFRAWGPDAFFGGAGNDTMSGGGGADYMFGGDGNDTLFTGVAHIYSDNLFGGAGDDKIYANARSPLLSSNGAYADGGDGNDLIDMRYANGTWATGGRGNDTIIGSNDSGADWLNGGEGSDIIFGGLGQDTNIDGGGKFDTGTDTLVYLGAYGVDLTVNNDNYYPDALKWVSPLNQTGEAEVGWGEAAKNIEYIQFSNGSYHIASATFTSGLMRVNMASILSQAVPHDPGQPYYPYDIMSFGIGITTGGDTATAGAGDQVGDTGWGQTNMAFGAGNDTYVLDDTFYNIPITNIIEQANEGIDTAVFRPLQYYVQQYTLANNVEIGLLYFQENGPDIPTLTGNSGNNLLVDYDDNNPILWESGERSTLVGGDGNDILYGGNNNDTLSGGNGIDTVVVRGNRADYTIGAGGSSITDNVTTGTNDGTDQLSGIEKIQFANGTLDLATNVFTAQTNSTTSIAFMGGQLSLLNGRFTVGGGGTSGTSIPYPTTSAPIQGDGDADGTTGNDRVLTDTIANKNINTQAGDDYVTLSGWNLHLNAGDGNDVIEMFAVDSYAYGGNGNDIFVLDPTKHSAASWITHWATIHDYTDGQDRIAIENGSVTSFVALQAYMTQTGSHVTIDMPDAPPIIIENVSLSALTASDFIFSTSNYDRVGTSGADTLNGTANYDAFYGAAGNDTMNGGWGNDAFYIGTGSGFDAIAGDLGWDRITATADNTVIGLSSVSGIERITHNGFNNVSIAGSSGDNVLNLVDTELVGITSIDGGAGNDTIRDGSGWNYLVGGAGNDSIYGNGGNDTLVGGAGSDLMDGGDGTDTADYSMHTVLQTINLSLTGAQTIATGNVDTLANIENVLGGSANDTITGSSVNNRIEGNGGNDRMTGGAGNDEIVGGAGTTDTAVYAGLKASYTLSTNNGVTIITDNQATTDGNDGSDTLTQTERAEFKGGVIQALAVPIILDLNGDGVSTFHMNQSHARFDWDGDGVRDKTGWMGRGDGMLMIDRDGDGHVSGANELSFIDDKPGAKSDLDGLTAFDSNGDGVFSMADDEWGSFRIWIDRNGNGREDRNELVSMEQAGVSAINLSATHVNRDWDWDDNITINTGNFVRSDGSSGGFGDIGLAYQASANLPGQAVDHAQTEYSLPHWKWGGLDYDFVSMRGHWDSAGADILIP